MQYTPFKRRSHNHRSTNVGLAPCLVKYNNLMVYFRFALIVLQAKISCQLLMDGWIDGWIMEFKITFAQVKIRTNRHKNNNCKALNSNNYMHETFGQCCHLLNALITWPQSDHIAKCVTATAPQGSKLDRDHITPHAFMVRLIPSYRGLQ